ncbi:MAG: TonB-dependent receptor [Rhodospirillales bacterium]|nr:TonB-dependent receptor [Rhodospirillales bacterium]
MNRRAREARGLGRAPHQRSGIVSVRAWWLSVTGAMVITAATSAGAQTPDGESATPIADEVTAEEMEVRHLDAISVTATRNPMQAFDYPGMVSVVRRNDIRMGQGSSPDDILSFVPNVEFTSGPRRTGETPSIRGLEGADVIVLFDGARQNFGSTHDGRFFIDPSLLDSVEVLRGPASSLYGSGATGGVIEFRTVNAADLLEQGQNAGAAVSVGYQDVNSESRGTFTVYGRAGHGLDVIGSVTKRDSGAITLGDGSELGDTDDDIIAALAKAGTVIGDNHRLEASFLRFANTATEPNNGQGEGGRLAPGLVEKAIRSDTFRVAYKHSDPSNALLDLDIVAYLTDMQADELRLDDEGLGPRGELLKRDVATIGLRLDNRSRLEVWKGISTTLTYGAEYYRDDQVGAAGSRDRDGVPDAETAFLGSFVQAETLLDDGLGLLPGHVLVVSGLRYDEYETSSQGARSNEDGELSSRLGVSWTPTRWLMAFANYGDDFRAPTINEIYLSGIHFRLPLDDGLSLANRFVENPDLRPQKTRTMEFGGGLSFDDIFESGDSGWIKASHFRIAGEDFIDISLEQPPVFGPNGLLPECRRPGACDGRTVSTNVSKAMLDGWEIEAMYESARLRVTLGFSSIDGTDETTGEHLGVLTPDQLSTDLLVKLPEIDSAAGWRLLAADSFDKVNDEDEERSGYEVHNVYFSWQPSLTLLKGVRIDLGVDNLFDKAYSRVFTGAFEPGRNVKASASYSLRW